MTSKSQELRDEIRTIFTSQGNLLDTLIPPVLFIALNSLFSFEAALVGSLGVALLFTAVRLLRKQSLRYALGGLGGVALAVLAAWLLGRAEGFFLPTIISGGIYFLLTVISLLVRRPLAAWSSFLARRWPREWYWHPRVRPAYTEVTWLWLVVFGLRLALQVVVLQKEDPTLLGITNLLSGWPVTISLLIASYLYGTWRLGQLQGPSVEEFKNGAEPPWSGQRSGF
jgi:hypothetical protein